MKYKFSDFVHINPYVPLTNDSTYSYVEMKDLQEGKKYCSPSTELKVQGGARFIEGDTLFAKITPCLENGKICKVKGLKKGVGFGSTEFFVFRGRKNISDNDFVYYLSRWNEVRDFAESNFEGTSGRQRVPRDCFDELFLELPGLSEQRMIASILCDFDDKIDLLHRQNKVLEQLAETLFRQFIEDADVHWKSGPLTKFIIVKHGFAFKGEFITNIENPNILLTPGNFHIGGGFKADKFKYYKGPFPEEFILCAGDLIITMTDLSQEGSTLGYPAFVPSSANKKYLHNQRLGKAVFNSDSLMYKYYIYFLLKSENYRNYILGSATGTTVRHTSPSHILNYEITFPDKKSINTFNAAVESMFNKIDKNQSQINLLAELRDSLLPKLMNGEVKIT